MNKGVLDAKSQSVATHESEQAVGIGLVLADSCPILLDGMDRLFRSEPSFRVLASCGTGDEAVRAVRSHRPHVLVLDLAIAGKDAIAVLKQVTAEPTPPRVVVYAERFSNNDMLEATRHGALGLILKTMPPQLLIQCVRKVHRGGTWIEKSSTGRVVDYLVRLAKNQGETVDRLTPKELDVLRLAARGDSNKEIADKLRVREGTVKAHIHHLYEKLGVRGRIGLVLAARDKGLLSVLSSEPRDSSCERGVT